MLSKAFSFLFIWATALLHAQNAPIHLIPQPAELQQSGGVFTLTGNAGIGFNQSEARAVAEMLAQKLNAPTGFALKAQ